MKRPPVDRVVTCAARWFRIQRRLRDRVTVWSQGQTWNAEPSIGVDLPAELYEGIDETNAEAVAQVLSNFRDQMVALLKRERR